MEPPEGKYGPTPSFRRSSSADDYVEVTENAESGAPASKGVLRILHFNDVYNVEDSPVEPVGGAARFASAIREKQSSETTPAMVLFSGDLFNPSLMSTATKGKHMVEVVNALGVHVACCGNHDFDHGLDIIKKRISECDFPWLLSNVKDKESSRPLADAHEWTVLDWHGWRVGVLGLIEREWLATLAHVDEDEVVYEDYVTCGDRLGKYLREVEGCDVVIALTHMRSPNDERLTRESQCMDLVLGGHDHEYELRVTDPRSIMMLKSGTDFREFSEVWIREGRVLDLPSEGGVTHAAGPNVTVSAKHFKISSTTPEDPDVAAIVEKWSGAFVTKMKTVVGEVAVPLDCLFASVRCKETNAGNWIASLARKAVNADIALLNSGTLRADRVIGPGTMTLGDLVAILPMQDPMVKLALSGAQVIEALENGVSMYPKREGRFPLVAGIRFEFAPAFPPGRRVILDSVTVNGKAINLDATYSVVTKAYLALGKDGYTMFADAPVLLNDECAPLLPTILRTHLRMVSAITGFRQVSTAADKSVRKASFRLLSSLRHTDNTPLSRSRSSKDVKEVESMHKGELGNLPIQISPVVDGRITIRRDLKPEALSDGQKSASAGGSMTDKEVSDAIAAGGTDVSTSHFPSLSSLLHRPYVVGGAALVLGLAAFAVLRRRSGPR